MRVFLSFHLPKGDAEEIHSKLGKVPGLDLYPTPSLHATIKFIGDVQDTQIEELNKHLSSISSKYGPFNLEFKNYFVEDERLRASLVTSPTLLQFQGEITAAIHQIFDNVKSQVYVPHVTLGRYTGNDLDSLPRLNFKIKIKEFVLFESVQKDTSEPLYNALKKFALSGTDPVSEEYKTIAIPVRPQPDTIVAIFILKHFGAEHFPGIASAGYKVMNEVVEKGGEVAIDVGGGVFDHHSSMRKTTASTLVAEYLGVRDNPALTKLLQFAERDDFFGKGIISTDPLDRAFGLPGLIASLNKKHTNNPEMVIEPIIQLLDAFVHEEMKRAFEMPKELEEKLNNGQAETFVVKQRGKKLKCIIIPTENVSMAGFLRSKLGGGFDVVAIKLPTGHINILTKPVQRIDLRSLTVLIRLQEAEARGEDLGGEAMELSQPGTVKQIPEWYYDTATNSLLNGGTNTQNTRPTAIDPFEIRKILEAGLSEALWSPLSR